MPEIGHSDEGRTGAGSRAIVKMKLDRERAQRRGDATWRSPALEALAARAGAPVDAGEFCRREDFRRATQGDRACGRMRTVRGDMR